MKPKPKILFVSEDAGGVAALTPVLLALRKHAPSTVRAVFRDAARKAKLAELVRRFKPNLIVTAPGPWGLNADKRAIALARALGIPTVAVIDFWSNYAARFSSPGTRDLAFVPDAICAIDTRSKRELVAEGIESKRIIVTGNPSFDAFGARKGQGADILFFSQPFSELKRQDASLDWGYDERAVLTDLLDTLDAQGLKGRLVIKLHPRTKQRHVFDGIIARHARKVVIDRATPANRLIARALLVLGMNSMALFEASLAGKPVLSYQPGLKRPDPLMSNRLGLSTLVTDRRKLLPALRKVLSTKPSIKTRKIRQQYANGHATRNVLKLIDSLV